MDNITYLFDEEMGKCIGQEDIFLCPAKLVPLCSANGTFIALPKEVLPYHMAIFKNGTW
jgi:hypothetical protein